jgi:hypothetical protein
VCDKRERERERERERGVETGHVGERERVVERGRRHTLLGLGLSLFLGCVPIDALHSCIVVAEQEAVLPSCVLENTDPF